MNEGKVRDGENLTFEKNKILNNKTKKSVCKDTSDQGYIMIYL